MRPLTLDMPKPLLQVLGKPLLAYTFASLPDVVDEVVLVIGYKEEQIRSWVAENIHDKKVTFVSQREAGGTGAALLLAQPYVGEGKFLTLFADDLYAKHDIEKLLQYERGMLLAQAKDPTRFGVVELDAAGRVIDIEEKPQHPKSNLISTGVYLLDEKVFAYEPLVRENGERYLPDMVVALAKEFSVAGVLSSFWIQIGYPEDIANAEKMLLAQNPQIGVV
jgi:bifunctional UDP-N-acetylglucosamine pyrophosphorylase/glucosamine-1-phosphate N-acetyltransferase